MKLFEKRSLSLFRKYHGCLVSELDKKQINSINKLYLRFIGVSKRIEAQLNCPDCIFITPDQYNSTESESVLSPYWSFQIFPSKEAYRLKLGYSISFAGNLSICFGFIDYSDTKLAQEVEYFISQFQGSARFFNMTQLNQELTDFRFINKLVNVIKENDLQLDRYIRNSDHLDILRSTLLPAFLNERELELKYGHLQKLKLLVETVPDKTFELLFRLKSVFLKKINSHFFEIIEDPNDENPSNLQLHFQDQNEPDDFQERAQRGKRKNLPQGSQPKQKRRIINGHTKWPRDPDITYTALDNASFTCELNALQTTFISDANRKPIMDGHHLVPMEFQDKFPVSIDVPENVICLCPDCHAAIHRAIKEQRFKIIESFFLSRLESLKLRGINISLSELLVFYKVSGHYFENSIYLNNLNPVN